MALGFGLNKDVLAAGAGIVVGGLQDAALSVADSQSMLGTPMVPQVGSNGELINLVTGGTATAIGVVGALGKGTSRLFTNRSLQGGLVGYGLTTFFGGYLLPKIVQATSGGTGAAAFSFAGTRANSRGSVTYQAGPAMPNRMAAVAPVADANRQIISMIS